MQTITRIYIFLILSLCIVSCGDDPIVTDPNLDFSDVLDELAEDVILHTYQDLADQAMALHQQVQKLKLEPSQEELVQAQNQWIATRSPWEKSEGFLFGPVDTEGIDPAIDSWPVNQVDLENVLMSGNELTTNFVESLEGTLKGFHTIEFLLWGGDSQKEIADFTNREFEYLLATTEVLLNDTKGLADFWAPENGNFIINIKEAGESSSIYLSQKAAIEEMANGILNIADELGNGKINDPLEQVNFSLEESQFSNNSKVDFADNVRSIELIYEGITGNGLTSVVKENDIDLDNEIRTQIKEAILSIENIPGTFTNAIPLASPTRPDALHAQEQVRILFNTLESKLIPLISNL